MLKNIAFSNFYYINKYDKYMIMWIFLIKEIGIALAINEEYKLEKTYFSVQCLRIFMKSLEWNL